MLCGKFFFIILLLFPLNAMAVPSVVVSLKPLQSLVAAVMDGVGVPYFIIHGSGHGYQLRPGDAKKLADADIIIWIGPQMEAFLVKPLGNLLDSAEVITLSDVQEIQLLDVRGNSNFFEACHHNHGDFHCKDLHFWLDPKNAEAVINTVAHVLIRKDPINAQRYSQNAKAYGERLNKLTTEIDRELAPFRSKPFVVFHDAYQYFEKRFGLSTVGAIAVNPEQQPSVKRIAKIRDKVKELGSVCVFSEPQFESQLVKTVTEGTDACVGSLDPLGIGIASGPDQYLILIRNLADSLKNCLEYLKKENKTVENF